MNVVVCNGSYNYDFKKRYVKVVLIDQDNYLWVVNSGGKLRFPGYCVEENDDYLDKAVTCLYNFFGSYSKMDLYSTFSIYSLAHSKDENGKRLTKNNLSVIDCFIASVNNDGVLSNRNNENLLVKKSYEELKKNVSRSTDATYREEMLTMLKMLPDELKEKKLNVRCLVRR